MPKKLTHDFVKVDFKKEGCKLTSTKYINAHTKLDYICDKGHEHSITWSSWNAGHRCSYCAGLAKPLIEEFRLFLKDEGFILLEDTYINNYTNMKCICSYGHKCSTTWNRWKQGKRCPYCSGKDKKTIDFIRQKFAKEDYICSSTEYINAKTKLDYICPNGHRHSITWDSWNHNKRCPDCQEWGTSKFEKQVKDFVLSLNQNIIENDRTLIKNPNTGYHLELDILFICKTKAIECNGAYYHARPEIKEKDKIKVAQCKNLNIDLLVVDYDEWTRDQEKQKLKIKRFISDGQ